MVWSGIVQRQANKLLDTAMADTPVVMVTGPRQCGKTTLVRDLAAESRRYVTLDDPTAFSAAQTDPLYFLRDQGNITIDEVQRAPDLLRAIKLMVDQDRRPGRFVLTGSANLLTLPGVSESLAGRMEIVPLYPLAMSEISVRESNLLEDLLAGRMSQARQHVTGRELEEKVLTGGYPEMLLRADAGRRQRWARDYLRAIVERDVRDIAEIEKLDQMPRLLRMLSLYAGELANYARIGAEIRLDEKTARKYLGILEQLFLVRRLEPWSRHAPSRMVRTPKLHFLDSGLLAALRGVTAQKVETDRRLFGHLLECFVYAELLKLVSWRSEECRLFHYRDKDQYEVDFVLQELSGKLAGVEVKASSTVTAADFRGLRKLQQAAPEEFQCGVVLYDGEESVAFGEKLFAVPLSCFWP